MNDWKQKKNWKFWQIMTGSLVLMMIVSCSSRRRESPRKRPDKVLECSELYTKIDARDQFFRALRGQAYIKTSSRTIDLDIALEAPNFVRAEIVGPLGVRLAYFFADNEWVQFFLPREKVVHRLPADAFWKNTLRREAFLGQLPIPIVPQVFIAGVLNIISLDRLGNVKHDCRYDESSNAYVVVEKSLESGDQNQSYRVIYIDPTGYFPIKTLIYDTKKSVEVSQRPVYETEFSRFEGAGISTLATKQKYLYLGREAYEFHWKRSESWPGRKTQAPAWKPKKAVEIIDY